MSKTLEKIFDAESFRKKGHLIVDFLADRLQKSHDSEGKVIRYRNPEEERAYWNNYNYSSLESFMEDFMRSCTDLHHPKYMGHQVAVPAPLASLMGLVSDHLNNGMGVYEMGMAATVIESLIIKLFCQKLGYDNDSDGFLTSGGTLANLTALLSARNHCLSIKSESDLSILVSEQAHFCIERAAMTMGFKPDQLIKIKTDDKFCIDTSDLVAAHEKQVIKGRTIMCIVGCACTTATGSYDDIKFLSEYCGKHKIWLHIDGAHGGPVVFSEKYRHLVEGIEAADSVVIDLHKMMMIPALATAILFKRGDDSYNCFHQEAKYLFNQENIEWFTLAKRTYETTKYMMSIKLYVTLKEYGETAIEEYIDHQYELCLKLYQILSKHKDFECAHKPMSNILCFRYIADDRDENELNSINRKIRQRLLDSGQFYIVQTILNKKTYLRSTLMNPFTQESDLNKLIEEISRIVLNENNKLS
jgi:L-2,4-diaminobutyrate decarboxylase